MGWLSPGSEDCSRFLNKLLKEESSVASSLLVEAVATQWGWELIVFVRNKILSINRNAFLLFVETGSNTAWVGC